MSNKSSLKEQVLSGNVGFTRDRRKALLWIFMFPPLGLHFIWKQNNTLNRNDKVLYTLTCIVYTIALLFQLFSGRKL